MIVVKFVPSFLSERRCRIFSVLEIISQLSPCMDGVATGDEILVSRYEKASHAPCKL